MDDRAGLSLLSRLVGAIAVVVGHLLGPLVRVAIQAAIACKQIAITSHRQNLQSSSPTSPILDSLMFYLELQSIHRLPPPETCETSQNLAKTSKTARLCRSGSPVRERRGLLDGFAEGVLKSRPLFMLTVGKKQQEICRAEAPNVKPVAMASAMAGSSVAVDTQKPVIRSSTGVPRAFTHHVTEYPPIGISSKTR